MHVVKGNGSVKYLLVLCLITDKFVFMRRMKQKKHLNPPDKCLAQWEVNAGEAVYGAVGADLLSFCRREKRKEVGK